MANLQASKSILAKLMATENISVSHQNVQTAYFDLKSRTIVLPVWKEMDGDLYDLLTGHEVGHALDTPEQGWHSAIDGAEKSERRKYKDFLNVIEDARIERRQKRRYPGLGKSFANAYKNLYDRDFFGIKKLGDLSKLNLIDRINLYYKLGTHVVVKFTDAERDYLREIDNAETWEQVEDIAKRVYGYVKANEKDKIQNKDDLEEAAKPGPIAGEDEDDDFKEDFADEDYDDDDESEDSEEDMEGDGFSDDVEESEDDGENGSDQKIAGGDKGEENDDEPQSITDRAFREKEKELVNSSGEVHMLNLPEADLSQIILSNTEVMNDLELFIHKQVFDKNKIYGRNGLSFETIAQKCVAKFNKNNKKYITHILKEFEMRKKASEYARTTTARTGELNMNVLHKYKFSNDLFKKINVVQKGKSHGLIMYVDMSGSMCDIFRNTIEQALVLASFCKLANIPFDIYGFTDDQYFNRSLMGRKSSQFISDPTTEMFLQGGSFHLKHLLGSSFSGIQYRRSFNLLAIVTNEYNRYDSRYYQSAPPTDRDHGSFDRDWSDGGFGLGSTPFIETLLASREMIKKFQNANKLDIVNVLYLTDGEGNGSLTYPAVGISYAKSVIYIIDKQSGKKIRAEDHHSLQSAVTQLVADVTGCKHLGFYLVSSSRSLRYEAKKAMTLMEANEAAAAAKCVKDNNFFAAKALGYSKYFYVCSSDKNITDEELKVTADMTKSKMAAAFNKLQNGKKSNRLLVSKFAEELAVA